MTPGFNQRKPGIYTDSLSTRRPQRHIDIYCFSWESLFIPDDTGIRTNEDLELRVRTGTTTPGLYVPGSTLLDHNTHPAQISPAIYSPAARRSAVPSRTVRCRALRCGAVSCCAVCFLSNIEQYRVYYVLLCTDILFSLFLPVFDLSRRPCFFPHANCPGTADQNVTPITSTQHS